MRSSAPRAPKPRPPARTCRVAQADLRLEVARAFWAVVTARATVDVLEQGVERAQAHVADVRERFNAGLVPPNEVASAEAQESRQRMLLIEARNQRDVAAADLARLVGADAWTVARASGRARRAEPRGRRHRRARCRRP